MCFLNNEVTIVAGVYYSSEIMYIRVFRYN